MKTLLVLSAILLSQTTAQATPLGVKIGCEGKDITLTSHKAEKKWSVDPYYYEKSNLISVEKGTKTYTLLVQNPDFDSTVGVLHATGIVVDDGDSFFEFFVNLKSKGNNATLKIDGSISKTPMECWQN